jgi:hypothetical protein
MNWYQNEVQAKRVRQVVVEAGAAEVQDPKFRLLLLTSKFLPLLTSRMATGFFFLDGRPGPFLMVRADGLIEELRGAPLKVAFSFYRMPAGGLVGVDVFIDSPVVAKKLAKPFVLFEIAYGLDVENEEMKKALDRAFSNDFLHLCFTQGEAVATVSDGVVQSSGLDSEYDVLIPLDVACKEALQTEYRDILSYHAAIPAGKRDYRESVGQMWAENPEDVLPILKRKPDPVPVPAQAVAIPNTVPLGILKRGPLSEGENHRKKAGVENGALKPSRPKAPYSMPIDRKHPGCFLFLVDQSGSMLEPFGEADCSKARAVADAINGILQDLCLKCSKDDGVRDYFDVGVIGYGDQVGFAFGGTLTGRGLVKISEVEDQPIRVEPRSRKMYDGAGSLVDMPYELPIWFDPLADGDTPMCEALRLATKTLGAWIAHHPDSYPPIVINISDGAATDGDPCETARSLVDLSTQDGHVLVFNCHISTTAGDPLVFADDASKLMDRDARRLFEMSSVMPEEIRKIARAQEYQIADGARGFAFNAHLADLIRFLNIGTSSGAVR